MKSKFQFYKNIILVVASALTLVAVTFAWFTTNFSTSLDQYKAAISGETLTVDFYQADEAGKYEPLSGDITLDNFVPGNFNNYKFEIITKTADKLKMSFSIDGLDKDIPQELKEAVCIKYSLYKLRKRTSANGDVAYINSTLIYQSDGYILLSELQDGKIIPSLSLANYQENSGDRFAIYYEIGLSEDAPAEISGMEYGLGSIKISAQRIG